MDTLIPNLRKNKEYKFATGDQITIADICMAAFYFELVLHDCNRNYYSMLLNSEKV